MKDRDKWFVMAAGTMFLAYVANLGAKLFKANKATLATLTFAGLIIGATYTANILKDKEVIQNEELT
uniref:Uncharacterized protein n=1 Tax=viral metagenome TaxID=1070528 RepID=A0A6M3J873_9ZZZZ